MWYHLLTSIGSSTLSTLTIDVTYMDDGTLLDGISIDLTNVGTGTLFFSGETNSSGRFVINNVPSGTYTVTVNSEDDYTFYINEDTFRSYSIEKTSNIDDGLLYNWLVIDTGLLAPSGWHVPTQAEFQTLHDYVTANGYSGTEGDALKSTTGWTSNNGVDAFGFNWQPSGRRSNSSGLFSDFGGSSQLWSSDTNVASRGVSVSVSDGDDLFDTGNNIDELEGFSVRLIRDSSTGWSEGDILTDLDSNIYNTIKIGTQIWTIQNFACTQLNDGTAIDNLRTSTEWTGATDSAYCAYDNNSQNVFVSYTESNVLNGRLYNWHAVDNVAGIAPTNLIMPSESDFNTLEAWLTANGYSGTEGAALADNANLWTDGVLDSSPNFGATTFNTLPSGLRDSGVGSFLQINSVSRYMTTSESGFPLLPVNIGLSYNSLVINSDTSSKASGFSIRMLVDPAGEYAEDGAKYTDPDGNVYDVVQIGTQFWLAQNWACTKYADGSTIAEITDNATWTADTTGALCAYDNDDSYIYK